MNGNHKIRTLGVHTRFDSEAVAMESQKALTAFAGERLPRIMEEVFNSRSRPGLIRRFGRVELDLGAISEDEFPDGIEERLRQKLADFFDNHPVLREPVLSSSNSRQLAFGQAEEEAILYFLENGTLPWHGPFSNAEDITASLGKRLETRAAYFINRLKALPDIKTMVTRLVRQFPEEILEKILETAVPGRGRSTREVIQGVAGGYAAGAGHRAGKDSGSRAGTVGEIKDHVWEHVLRITLGAPGIFPVLLKLALSQHDSPEARQEISRVLQRLPGTPAMAFAGGGPNQPDASPVTPSFWARRFQKVMQTSGRQSDRLADPDLPRIWGEVILHCFDALDEESPVKQEAVLTPAPPAVSPSQEFSEEEPKFRKTITDHPVENCPDKQTHGDQIRRPAESKSINASPGKEVLSGVRPRAGAATSVTQTAKGGADTVMTGALTGNNAGSLERAVLNTRVQKNEAPESAEPLQSIVGRHSFWADKTYAALQKNGEKTFQKIDPDFFRLQGKAILRAFESLADDVLAKLETALNPFPVPVSRQREKSDGEREAHETITENSLDNCLDKQVHGDQIRRPAQGKSVKESSREEGANGGYNLDNGGRIGGESRSLGTEIPEDGADAVMPGLSMENSVGPTHGDSRNGHPDSGILDGDVPGTPVRKDEAAREDVLLKYSIGRDAFGGDKIQVERRKSGRRPVRSADSDLHRTGYEGILHGAESLADGIQIKPAKALKPFWVPVSRQREKIETELESNHPLGDNPLGNCPNKQAPGDQIRWPGQGKSVKDASGKEVANDAEEPDNGFRIGAGSPALRDERITGDADAGMTRPSMENLTGSRRGDFRGGNPDSDLLDKAALTSAAKKDETTENPLLFQSDAGSPFVRSGEMGYNGHGPTWPVSDRTGPTINCESNSATCGHLHINVYLQWIQRLLDCLGAMADNDAPACFTGEALPVMGDMIFDAAVSTPNPEMFLAELSSMVARQVAGGAASFKKRGRVPVEKLTGQLLHGAEPLKARGDGVGRPDDPASVLTRNFAGRALENLCPGTPWQVILSNAWRWILMAGTAPGFTGPDHTSDKTAAYLSVMDRVLSLPPEKRAPFSIRVLFRFAERMQLPITPFPDLPGLEAEAQSPKAQSPKAKSPKVQSGNAGDSKIGKIIAQASETYGDSGSVLGASRNFRPADQSLPHPGQEARNVPSGSKHRIGIPFEKLNELFQNPVVQNNIRSTLNMEEVWDVIQVIVHQKIRKKGFETVLEKFKSDACIQQQNFSDDKQNQDLDRLADRLSLILKNGPDPKDFLLRILTGLISGDPHKEHGPGEHPESPVPGDKNPGTSPAEKNLERAGGARPTRHPAGEQRVAGAGKHSAAASREWGRKSEPVFVENAGMVLAGPYLSMLFKKLDLLDNKAFKSHYAAEKAVHILEYMVTGEQSAPEYRLMLNKLLCGLEPDRPIHKFFLLEKAQTDVIRELILSMIAHWKVLGKTSVEGFRQSFLTREGRLEAGEDAWNLVVAPKPFDMLLDRIPWTFSPIRLPWMDRVLYVHWR